MKCMDTCGWCYDQSYLDGNLWNWNVEDDVMY
jgi:hypothetical protein